MSTMVVELYEALVDAGASKEKAAAAATALAEYGDRFNSVDAQLLVLRWMAGFNLAFAVAILWRVAG